MPRRAIIESRPWLLASVIAAVSYYIVQDGDVPGLYLIVWKAAAAGLLAVYCWRRSLDFDGTLIAAVMALSALGDAANDIDLIVSGIAFATAQIPAIWLYARNRRRKLAFSQRAFALLLVPITLLLSWLLPDPAHWRIELTLYSGWLAVSAAMAWTSRFPRFRVGIGAVLLVAADLAFISALGPFGADGLVGALVWPIYYLGQLLIATGVVRTLRRDHHLANA